MMCGDNISLDSIKTYSPYIQSLIRRHSAFLHHEIFFIIETFSYVRYRTDKLYIPSLVELV